MATYQKRGNKWRAQVRKDGESVSASFATKALAIAWATSIEAGIIAGKATGIPDKTFGDLLERYAKEVSVLKRGARWEQVRIALFLRDPIANIHLRDLNQTHFAGWRDRRLQTVQAGSVLRVSEVRFSGRASHLNYAAAG